MVRQGQIGGRRRRRRRWRSRRAVGPDIIENMNMVIAVAVGVKIYPHPGRSGGQRHYIFIKRQGAGERITKCPIRVNIAIGTPARSKRDGRRVRTPLIAGRVIPRGVFTTRLFAMFAGSMNAVAVKVMPDSPRFSVNSVLLWFSLTGRRKRGDKGGII